MFFMNRALAKIINQVCAVSPWYSNLLNKLLLRTLNKKWNKSGQPYFKGIRLIHDNKMAKNITDLLHDNNKKRRPALNSLLVFPVVNGVAHFFIITGIRPDEMALPEAQAVLEHEYSHVVEFQHAITLMDAESLDWELLADNRAAASVGVENYYKAISESFATCPELANLEVNKIRLEFLESLTR